MMDSSKPLTILSHVGGSPLLLFASRSKQNIQDYEEVVAWLKKTAAHVEKIAEKKSEPDEWAKYQEIRNGRSCCSSGWTRRTASIVSGVGRRARRVRLGCRSEEQAVVQENARVAEAAADV